MRRVPRTGPRAFLNYITFDRNFKPILTDLTQTNFVRMTTVAKETGTNVPHERLFAQIIVKQAGYMYVFLSNEETTPIDVYFDDFRVTQTKSPVVQTEDYYPFGLVFNEYEGENGIKNEYQYNGKEKLNDLSLDWIDYGGRMYMPEIGRWHAPDPKSSKYSYASPYNYVLNNPVKSIDLDGKDVIILIAYLRGGGTGHMGAIIQDGNGNWYYVNQGAADPNGNIKKMASGGVKGGMSVVPLNTKDKDEAMEMAMNDEGFGPYNNSVEIKTSQEMDAKIFDAATDLAAETMTGKVKYNLFTNNCVDALQEPIEKGTGVKMPKDIDPRPNKYFEKLKNNIQQLQKMINKAIDKSNKKEEKRQQKEAKAKKKKEKEAKLESQ